MRLVDVEVAEDAGGTRVRGTVVWERRRLEPETLEFHYRDVPPSDLAPPGDVLAPALLIPASAHGEDVVIDAPTSPSLVRAMGKVVDVHRRWFGDWHAVRIEAPEAVITAVPSETAACFSGGADSFFTVLRHADEIDTLLTLVGFTLSDRVRDEFDAEYVRRLAGFAERLGKRHVTVSSNAYVFGTRHVPRRRRWGWDNLNQCGALCGMALGLGPRIRRCFLASGFPTSPDVPAGRHPIVDPLWSTDTLAFVHEGAEYDRLDKVAFLADHADALELLSVCTREEGGAWNCRVCDKCQATGLMLVLAGAADLCPTLGPVTPATLRRTIVRPYRVGLFEDLRKAACDPAIERAITSALRRSRARRAMRPLGDVLRRLGLR